MATRVLNIEPGLDKKKLPWFILYPAKTLKGIAGVILFIPLTMILFGVTSYQQNRWPWDVK